MSMLWTSSESKKKKILWDQVKTQGVNSVFLFGNDNLVYITTYRKNRKTSTSCYFYFPFI